VKERTREIGVRKALGATTAVIQRQFFLEGFFLTVFSGGSGMLAALGLWAVVNLAPMPARFSGMIFSLQGAALSLLAVAIVGVVVVGRARARVPGGRGADAPPVDALRFEM